MRPEIVAELKKSKILFMGNPADTFFGFGGKRRRIAMEPFLEFRGGKIEADEIGAFTYMGCPNSELRHIGSIGRFCSIGPRLIAGPSEHPTSMVSTHSMMYGQFDKKWPELYTQFGWTAEQIAESRRFTWDALRSRSPRIQIGNDVWIGDGVFISRGVKIGDGAVIAAHSVVTKDVPPYAIAGGVPCKVIKFRFTEDVIARLLAASWWLYGPKILAGMDWTEPEAAVSEIERRIDGGLAKYQPQKIVFEESGKLS